MNTENIARNIIGSLADYLLVIWLQMKSYITAQPSSWQKGTKGDIVLIPGFGCSWTFFEYLANALNKIGYRIYTNPEFEHTAMSMDLYCKLLDQFLRRNNLKKSIFLCHSRGGKVSKYYSAMFPNDKPVKAIHIASRYKSSFWAKLQVFNLDEFDSNSQVLKIINADPDNKYILNLYPSYDNIYFSVPNEKLLNAINFRINVVGHTRILFNKETLLKIKSFVMKD